MLRAWFFLLSNISLICTTIYAQTEAVFKLLWRKKFVILVLALLVAFLPMAMTKEATALSKTIVTALGIDIQDGRYLVHTESFVFNFDPFGVPERKLSTALAPTIDEALAEIGMNQGRSLSFSHCSLVLLGSGLENTDLVELLMPFLKMPRFSNAAVLMWTNDDVEEVLSVSQATGDVRSAKLQQIAAFNSKKTTPRVSTNLEQFMRNMLGREGRAELNIIELETQGEETRLLNSEKSKIIVAAADGRNKPINDANSQGGRE